MQYGVQCMYVIKYGSVLQRVRLINCEDIISHIQEKLE